MQRGYNNILTALLGLLFLVACSRTDSNKSNRHTEPAKYPVNFENQDLDKMVTNPEKWYGQKIAFKAQIKTINKIDSINLQVITLVMHEKEIIMIADYFTKLPNSTGELKFLASVNRPSSRIPSGNGINSYLIGLAIYAPEKDTAFLLSGNEAILTKWEKGSLPENNNTN